MNEIAKPLNYYSNTELNLRLMSLVHKEREMLTEIILHIQEISRRKVHLEMGFSSMFQYMTEHLKYSPGSAMRRLDAAKIAKESPEVLTDLQAGSLNLSQVSMVEQSVRHVQKTTPQRSITKSDKLALLKELAGKTKSQSETLIAKAFGVPSQTQTKTTHQADESVTITLNFSKKEWEEIEQMRELLSHATGGGMKETLLHVAKQVIKQKTQARKLKSSLSSQDPMRTAHSAAELTESNSRLRVPVPARIKKEIWRLYKGCQYKDPQSGRLCGSKHFPTIEHRQPVWAGGGNEIQNLTVLCAAHNTFRYQKQARLI
jgi:hypothetical protein